MQIYRIHTGEEMKHIYNAREVAEMLHISEQDAYIIGRLYGRKIRGVWHIPKKSLVLVKEMLGKK